MGRPLNLNFAWVQPPRIFLNRLNLTLVLNYHVRKKEGRVWYTVEWLQDHKLERTLLRTGYNQKIQLQPQNTCHQWLWRKDLKDWTRVMFPEGNKPQGTIQEATPVALQTRSRLQTAPIIIDVCEGEVWQTNCNRDYELIQPLTTQIRKQQQCMID